MLFRILVFVPAVLAVGALVLTSAGGVSAHEHRVVGDYELEVGFLNEPALEGQLNALFFGVRYFEGGVPQGDEAEGEEEGGEPVEGLDGSITAEVLVGGGAGRKTLELEPLAGEPGVYVGSFVPTLAGEYTFRITGEIDGTPVDETFESGPNRFSSVEPLAEYAFPASVAGDGESGAVQALEKRVDELDAGGSDGTARALGVAGIVAGFAGLGLGGLAVLRRQS